MPIEATCQCGARFRLPDSAAGKRARCKRCGASVTIPSHDLYAISEPERSAGDSETRLAPPPLPVASPHHPDDTATTHLRSGESGSGSREAAFDELSRGRTFRQDLLDSFVFLLEPANAVTIGALALMLVVAQGIGAMVPIGGLLVKMAAGAYAGAFCFAVLLETASGEDDLPTVMIKDLRDDLVGPALEFAGSWLVVAWPALVLQGLIAADVVAVPDLVVTGLFVAGAFFWPAVVLMVAIGNGLSGLWPHSVIRTVMAAPASYLAIWCVLLVAALLLWVPNSDAFASFVINASPARVMILEAVNIVLSLIVAVIAMRVIGLFYRHHKHRFPWVAE